MPRTTTALAVAALSLVLVAGGCSPGRGKYTSEGLQKAQERVAGLKSANEYQQAWQAYTAGDLDKAMRAIERSITLNPGVAKSHVLRGRIEIEQGNLERSLESFQKAQALDPTNVESHYYTGIVYERFSQPETALEHFTKAAELEPTSAQYALAAAEMMIDLERLDDAEQFLNSRTASFRHNAGVRQTLGHIAMMRGDAPTAVRLFSEARLLGPDDPSILEDLVHAQIATGQFAEAEFNITRLLSAPGNRERRDLMHMRARCLTELDRAVDAREIYRQLTSGDDGQRDVEAWIGLGNTSYILRDNLRLRQASQRVLSIAPARPEGYILRAWFQLRTNNPQQALTSLDQAIERRGSQIEPLLLKAVVLKQLDRGEEARQMLSKALADEPSNAALAAAIAQFDAADQPQAVTNVPVNGQP